MFNIQFIDDIFRNRITENWGYRIQLDGNLKHMRVMCSLINLNSHPTIVQRKKHLCQSADLIIITPDHTDS